VSDYFEYKGYIGSAEVSVEDKVLHGKLLHIRDTITYEADDPTGLEKAFHEAVDDYLDSCQEAGDTPDTPFKGSFNVRVGAQLHRDVAMAARQKKTTLNEYVRIVLDRAVTAEPQHIHHHHEVTVQIRGQPTQRVVSAGMALHDWESMNVASSH